MVTKMMSEYIITGIDPSLYEEISKIEIEPKDEIIESTKRPARFKLKKGAQKLSTTDKESSIDKIESDYKVMNHYLVLPSLILLANIRDIAYQTKFDKNTICEMEALVKSSNNKFAKSYPWLYNSLNAFDKIPNFYMIQYHFVPVPEGQVPLVFIHESFNKEKEETFIQPECLNLENFKKSCLVGKEFGGCNMFLISNIETV